MENKLIFTRMRGRMVTAFFEQDCCMQLECETEETSLLGNLYIGKVKNIVKNIHAAFVEIFPGKICFLPLDEAEHAIFTSKISSKPIAAQDELLVQVKKESIKTKTPGLTANFCLTGQYLILSHGNTRIGFSSKLDRQKKKELKDWILPFANESYGFIVRTNAAEAPKEVFLAEVHDLIHQYEEIVKTANFRTCYSVLKKSEPACIQTLKNTYHKRAQEIVTDQEDLYKAIVQYENHQPEEFQSIVRFYQDSFLPLFKLYNLERELERAMQERVWLKSGGYLVIQPTEALTVIDVNTGKCVEKKEQQKLFLKINKEAAQEIARQLRLRNLSGIIVVDFVNMEEESAKSELLSYLESFLNRDPIKTSFVDMTSLGLVEITRKKVKKPLLEQWKECSCENEVFSKNQLTQTR